jgi:glucokinase
MGPSAMAESDVTIGVDIGGTRIKAVAAREDGTIVAERIVPTIDDVESLVAQVGKLIASFEAPTAAIGISAPGIAARDNRSIAWMRGRMGAVEGLDWQRRLERNVRVLNDAHAATVAEAWIGAARGAQHAVMLTLGTGVGGGVIVDGRLLQGATGRAGHLGHVSIEQARPPDIVGTPGSIEDAIGNHTLAARSGGRFTDTSELVKAVQQGDRAAADCWQRSVRSLAVGITSLVNAFDPEVVVLGGGIAESGPALFDLLTIYMDELEWRPTGQRVPIVAAKLGELSGAIGAARFAALATCEERTR